MVLERGPVVGRDALCDQILPGRIGTPLAERQARYHDMMAQLRENNVSVWRDNFMRDLQNVDSVKRARSAKPRAVAGAAGAARKRAARATLSG